MVYINKLIPFLYYSLILIILSACGGGGSSSSNDKSKPVTRNLDTVIVDGKLTESFELAFQQTEVTLNGQGQFAGQSRTVNISHAYLNDDKQIYMAFTWKDQTLNNSFDLNLGPIEFDGVQVKLRSQTTSDTFDAKAVIAAAASSQYIDQTGSQQNTVDDTVGDGLGRLFYSEDNQQYTAEFIIPANNDMNQQDADLSEDTLWTFTLFESVNLTTGDGWIASPHSNESENWFNLNWDNVKQNQRPALPDNLSGLIVFLSQHEHDNGEIYSFDPATGNVQKLTDSPELKKDTLSLSNDRTQIAFMGTETPDNFESFEIYLLSIESGEITKLTNNNVADGHPAWSNDDSTLLYSSFRDSQGASLIIANLDGDELIDLTPFGSSDNDGEFLPDGSIVFKTNRFQAEPEVTLATMLPDGTMVEALTQQVGVSDHDPVGNETHVLFERFNKDTYYFEDVDAGFVGWDIVSVNLTNKEETLLVADGWINWLPLYSPNNQYILYLKGVGAYTDAQLITVDGQSLGRLIPGFTRMKYIDWK